MSRLRLRHVRLALLCAALSGVVGCGAQTAEVTGTVKHKGNAPNLQGLCISFIGESGQPVTAEVAADGTYKAVGVPVGPAQVIVVHLSAARAEARKKAPEARRPNVRDEKARPLPTAKGAVAERYADAFKSGLSFTVEAGKPNVFDVNLTD
jgi:hypothetical protein